MMHTLGILFIALGASGLAIVALRQLIPGLGAGRNHHTHGRIRIQDSKLLASSGPTRGGRLWAAARFARAPQIVTATDDLLSEVRFLRTELAQVTEELAMLRQRLEDRGFFAPESEASPMALRRAA